MSGREAFGPNLRRLRLQRGLSLQEIAGETHVAEVLWAGLENNDFSAWPNGIFARAFVRDYARFVGADPDTTVDEFCRWFPQGDRRVNRHIREHAELLQHDLRLQDEVPPHVSEDRRWSPEKAAREAAAERAEQRSAARIGVFGRLLRAFDRT